MGETSEFDVVIVGSGLVGSSLCLSLGTLRVALIEARPLTVNGPGEGDVRPLSLNYRSYRILQELEVWDDVSQYGNPINTVHVSDKGYFGITRICAEEYPVEALGYVVEVHRLAEVLLARVKQSNAHIFAPATVQTVQPQGKGWQITLDCGGQEQQLTGKLLVAADGVNSTLRQQLNLEVEIEDYQQTAVVTNVALARHHQHVAYERFTPEGTVALLPLTGNRAGVVWSAPQEIATELLALTGQQFQQRLQKQFGYRAGRFLEVGSRHSYPLRGVFAKRQVADNFILLGNSAHTLNPVAAQGFNLGLADAAQLASCLLGNQSQDFLAAYLKQRQPHQYQVRKLTENIIQWFGKKPWPMPLLRNLGLLGLSCSAWHRSQFAKLTMGISDD